MKDTENINEAEKIFKWTCNYLKDSGRYPVHPGIKPGDVRRSLENRCPDKADSIGHIFEEFKTKILPGITHWNHPGFFAYFNSSACEPAVWAEMLSAAINTNPMLWHSSPGASELEGTVTDWLQALLGLSGFWGIIYDGGSSSTFHALCAMREKLLGKSFRESGFKSVDRAFKPLFYLSEQTHNSVHKALLTLGFGLKSIRYVDVNERFEMSPKNLSDLITRDRKKGFTPSAVIATLGSTSCTAIDPVKDIGDICKSEDLWFHIDAAHGGSAAISEKIAEKYKGWEMADSITVNPHKWMFVPIDLSVMLVKDKNILKNAFSFSAEYLKTSEDQYVDNYMDYGIPLGRRFRALKLWFTLKHFGKHGLKDRIEKHMEIAEYFHEKIKKSLEFETLAPLTLSTVCYRAIPASGTDHNRFNMALLDKINKSGQYFISHTSLNDKYTLRLVVSGLKTELKHVKAFYGELKKQKRLLDHEERKQRSYQSLET